MRTTIALLAILTIGATHPHLKTAAHATSHSTGAHWSYSGAEGPSHWAQLNADYKQCAKGRAQSPVNISTKAVYHGETPPLDFEYRVSPLTIIDNGHTVQVDYKPGSILKIGGDRYQLVQFHFHHPSEEEIDGKRSDMVAHLVHKDSNGRLAVVAVLLKTGRENPLLAELWTHLPKSGDHNPATGGPEIDISKLLPADHAYLNYTGSLTTPPCTEGVRWFVLKTPVEISKAQLDVFAARYPNDARPVQKLNGRHVIASR
jgi:carbonic anhydrase